MHENELIYLARHCNREDLKRAIYEKYFPMVKNLTNKLYRKMFRTTIYEYQEIINMTYTSFSRAFSTFDIKQAKYGFAQAWATINFGIIYRAWQKIKQKGHIWLNEAYEPDNYHNLPGEWIDFEDNERQQHTVKLICQKIDTYNPIYSKLVKLKMSGLSNVEIGRKLRINSGRIGNMFFRLSKIWEEISLDYSL